MIAKLCMLIGLYLIQRDSIQTDWESEFVSVQDDILALSQWGLSHQCTVFQILCSFSKSLLVWDNTDCFYPWTWRVKSRPVPFSSPLSFGQQWTRDLSATLRRLLRDGAEYIHGPFPNTMLPSWIWNRHWSKEVNYSVCFTFNVMSKMALCLLCNWPFFFIQYCFLFPFFYRKLTKPFFSETSRTFLTFYLDYDVYHAFLLIFCESFLKFGHDWTLELYCIIFVWDPSEPAGLYACIMCD